MIQGPQGKTDDEEEAEGDDNGEVQEGEETDETDDQFVDDDNQQKDRVNLRNVKPVNYTDESSDTEDISGLAENDNHDVDDEQKGEEQYAQGGDISGSEDKDNLDVEADVEDVQDEEVFNEMEV